MIRPAQLLASNINRLSEQRTTRCSFAAKTIAPSASTHCSDKPGWPGSEGPSEC